MTITEFADLLSSCITPRDCATFVRNNFDDLSLLFYDAAREDTQGIIAAMKKMFDAFMGGPVIREIHNDPGSCEGPILGLLILFSSFFERNGMYGEIQDAFQVMPDCAARKHLNAIYMYRKISDARTGYSQRFDDILEQLNMAEGDGVQARSCSIALIAEYYTLAVHHMEFALGAGSSAPFSALFRSSEKVRKYPILECSDLGRVFTLEVMELAESRDRQNIQAVENLYEMACDYISPPFRPDPTSDESTVDPESVHICLPHYLDCLIFGIGGLGGIYKPDPNAVRDGLAADDRRQQIYLGTYFPRSYAESYGIFHPLLSHEPVRDALATRRVLTILDVGSGTGGDLVGLLHAITDSNLKPVRIDIVSLEGNPKAILYQKHVIEECQKELKLSVNLTVHELKLPSTSREFASELNAFLQGANLSFDIAMTWKMLNEFYHKNYASAQGIYKAFIQSVAPHMSQQGLCVLLDMTNQVEGSRDYLPILMNREVRAYVQGSDPRLFHVIPRSCAHWGRSCHTDNCYTQRVFFVKHSRRSDDKSKVAYKVLAPEDFALKLNSSVPEEIYRCNEAKPYLVCRDAKIVYLPAGEYAHDGFILR